jgi:hypothetical protein
MEFVPENQSELKIIFGFLKALHCNSAARLNKMSAIEASSVKIYSKETIGRTVGRFCCNRQFLKIQG